MGQCLFHMSLPSFQTLQQRFILKCSSYPAVFYCRKLRNGERYVPHAIKRKAMEPRPAPPEKRTLAANRDSGLHKGAPFPIEDEVFLHPLRGSRTVFAPHEPRHMSLRKVAPRRLQSFKFPKSTAIIYRHIIYRPQSIGVETISVHVASGDYDTINLRSVIAHPLYNMI